MTTEDGGDDLDLESFLDRFLYVNEKEDDLVLTAKELEQLCELAKELFRKQPSLLEIHAPIYILGDANGEFSSYTLLRNGVTEMCATGMSVLCLGNYIGAGSHSLSYLLYVLALACHNSQSFYVLRGSHEADDNRDRLLPILRNRFQDDEGLRLWHLLNEVFAMMPLAALINKRVLCVHSGISPGLRSLDDIRNIARPTGKRLSQLVTDILCACPKDDVNGFEVNEELSIDFDEDAAFFARVSLGVDQIIRSNTRSIHGYYFFAERKICTIFSNIYHSITGEVYNAAALKLDRCLNMDFVVQNGADGNLEEI